MAINKHVELFCDHMQTITITPDAEGSVMLKSKITDPEGGVEIGLYLDIAHVEELIVSLQDVVSFLKRDLERAIDKKARSGKW